MTPFTLAALLTLTGPAGTPTELGVTVVPPPPMVVLGPVDFVHPNPLDVWQRLAPDRRGRFNRPRVVRAPDGTAFYLGNGQVAPYQGLFPRDENIWVNGTPYRSH